jgi:hypothetical protein
MVLWFAATSGIVRQPDEGAAARIRQLFVVSQLPIAGWFAIRWLPVAPRPGLLIATLPALASQALVPGR